MCVDMCIDMCIDMFIDMGIDMFIDMCIDMFIDMFARPGSRPAHARPGTSEGVSPNAMTPYQGQVTAVRRHVCRRVYRLAWSPMCLSSGHL